MSYFVNPVEQDECVFLSYEGEIPPTEACTARREANGVLDQRHWDRMVIDVTQVRSVPKPMELILLAQGLTSQAPRSMRIALVVRPEQTRVAKLVEKAARTSRVFLTYFVDPVQATAWVKRTGLSGPHPPGHVAQPQCFHPQLIETRRIPLPIRPCAETSVGPPDPTETDYD